jgi:hypothetical protein
MNPSSWSGVGRNSSFEVLWKDGDRVFCKGRHEGTEGDWRAVLVVAPVAGEPTPGSLNRLINEYGLRDELDEAWAARPLALVRERGRTMLVLNDPGGEPIERLLGAPMEVGKFLQLAIALSVALRQLHARGLIHKDIKPAISLSVPQPAKFG